MGGLFRDTKRPMKASKYRPYSTLLCHARHGRSDSQPILRAAVACFAGDLILNH